METRFFFNIIYSQNSQGISYLILEEFYVLTLKKKIRAFFVVDIKNILQTQQWISTNTYFLC